MICDQPDQKNIINDECTKEDNKTSLLEHQILSGNINTFPVVLYNLIEKDTNESIGWIESGTAFKVIDVKKFSQEILPIYFRHTKITSFQRQLNLYGFRRISRGQHMGAYYHPCFKQSNPHLLAEIRRESGKPSNKNLISGHKASGRSTNSTTDASVTGKTPPIKVGLNPCLGSGTLYKPSNILGLLDDMEEAHNGKKHPMSKLTRNLLSKQNVDESSLPKKKNVNSQQETQQTFSTSFQEKQQMLAPHTKMKDHELPMNESQHACIYDFIKSREQEFNRFVHNRCLHQTPVHSLPPGQEAYHPYFPYMMHQHQQEQQYQQHQQQMEQQMLFLQQQQLLQKQQYEASKAEDVVPKLDEPEIENSQQVESSSSVPHIPDEQQKNIDPLIEDKKMIPNQHMNVDRLSYSFPCYSAPPKNAAYHSYMMQQQQQQMEQQMFFLQQQQQLLLQKQLYEASKVEDVVLKLDEPEDENSQQVKSSSSVPHISDEQQKYIDPSIQDMASYSFPCYSVPSQNAAHHSYMMQQQQHQQQMEQQLWLSSDFEFFDA